MNINPTPSTGNAQQQMNENEKEFLNFYLDQTWQEMRHIEGLREKVTVLVVTLASAIVGFVVQQKFASETYPLIVFVMILGLFGWMMVSKLYQLHQRDQLRLDNWYTYYETYCQPNSQILILRDLADKQSDVNFSMLSKIKHHYFWSIIHIFISLGGLYILIHYYLHRL
jgi:hypothetical protein